jgi:mannose/fructose/N-acetylgalactosamine-specific phosphotransferase system component IIC
MVANSEAKLLITLAVLLVMVSVYTFLIMLIWNKVLMKKVKGADLQKLDFWDALAIGVFFSLVSGSTVVTQQTQTIVT